MSHLGITSASKQSPAPSTDDSFSPTEQSEWCCRRISLSTFKRNPLSVAFVLVGFGCIAAGGYWLKRNISRGDHSDSLYPSLLCLIGILLFPGAYVYRDQPDLQEEGVEFLAIRSSVSLATRRTSQLPTIAEVKEDR